MLKPIFSLLFFFGTIISYGQYYLEKVAPDTIDNLKLVGDSLYAAGDYKASSESFKKLSDYWMLLYKTGKLSDDQFQNYVFSQVYHRKLLFRIGERSESLQKLKELVPIVASRLGADHLINGSLYHELGLMFTLGTNEFQAAYDYTHKAMLIREEKLPDYKKDLGWSYNNLYIVLRDLKQLEKSEYFLLKALEVRKQLNPPEPAMMLVTYVNLSQLQILKEDRIKELEYLEKAEKAGRDLGVNHPYNLMVRTNLSKVYYKQAKFKEAIQLNKKALSYRKLQLEGEAEIELIDNYEIIVNSYSSMGYKDSASVYLDSVFYLRDKYEKKDAIVLNYQAKARLETDPNKAILHLKEALRLCPEDPQCRPSINALTNRMISDKYLDKDDAYQALIYASKSKVIYETDTIKFSYRLPQLYFSLAEIYYGIDQVDDAIHYVKEAVRLHDKNEGTAETWKVGSLRFLASIHSGRGDYEKAIAIFDRIERIIIDATSISDANKIDIYRYISQLYSDKGEKTKAIEYALKAKSYLNYNKGQDYYHALASLQLYHTHRLAGKTEEAKQYFIDACEFLGIKSWTELNFNAPQVKPFESSSYLEGTIDIYKYFDQVYELDAIQRQQMITVIQSMIDDCRDLFFYQSSEQELEKVTKRFYDLAVTDLYELYTEYKDPSLIKTAMKVIDKSKSININRALIQDDLASVHGLPADLLREEKRLIFLSERAFQEYNKTVDPGEEDNRKELVDQMSELSLQKDTLITYLKSDYPSYFEERYNVQASSIEESIALAKKNEIAFILYYWSSSKLYSLFIFKDQLEFFEIEKGKIDELLNPLLQQIIDKEFTSNELEFKKQRRDFIERASSLHKHLFPEQIYKELPNEIVIIPDGKLFNFPFEILLTEDVKRESYKFLPYIVRDKVTSYVGSLSQYIHTAKSPIKKEYLGFAPDYLTAARFYTSREVTSDQLSPLMYNQEEVELSTEIFDGLNFISGKATESNFKEHANHSGILHLAMHTSMNDRIPLDSHLNFTAESESSSENAKLYAHEIAQMKIDADLVVLSACQTNTGEEINGEAVRGIAKAFYMASCPHLILTNWLVDDKSSNMIITDFFKNIMDYKSTAESLREAKTAYLNYSSEVQAHPSYWAAYAYHGSSTKMEADSNTNWIWGLVFLLLSLILIGLIKYF